MRQEDAADIIMPMLLEGWMHTSCDVCSTNYHITANLSLMMQQQEQHNKEVLDACTPKAMH